MVKIIAACERDIPVIEDVLSDAAAWLDATGKSLWNEEQVSWAYLSKQFSASDFFIALSGGQPAACMALVDHDEQVWPDVKKGSSLFIHKLAVKRFAAGRGLSDALIAHAKNMCLERGISAVRLDCAADRPKLRAVYESRGFECVEEKTLFGKYFMALYKCDVHDTEHLYHYYDKSRPPLRSITSLPFDEAMIVLRAFLEQNPMAQEKKEFLTWFPSWHLKKRYEIEKIERDKFISIGGKPTNTAPAYFTLGANEGMKTWFDNLSWIKIPVSELDPDTVSFTYGDTFSVFNPERDTGEPWWGQVYEYDDILKLIDRYGWPEDVEYDMRNYVFPKDKPINQYLKYIEAHVWSDEVLDRYR